MKFTWLSNAPWAPTGYGNQTKVFIPRLIRAGHEIAIISFYGLDGGILGGWNGVQIFPKFMDDFGNDVAVPHTKFFGANVMLSLMDTWVLKPSQFPWDFAWIPWFPIDSDPISPRVYESVKQAFARIVFSKFGTEKMDEVGLDYHYVPHGIDTQEFRPQDMTESREELELPQDKFIVGMVAANKGNPSRKAFTQNIEAFALLKKNHPDVLLYLHTMESGFQGVNLPEFIQAMGLKVGEDVVFPSQYHMTMGFPPRYLRAMYNSFDVKLLVSMGEGFGIPVVEAQACGTPVIIGDWTATGELCFSGWKIPKSEAQPVWTPLATYQFSPNVGAIHDALELAYKQKGNEVMRRKARKGAMDYDADHIVETYWQPVLSKLEQQVNEYFARNWATIGLYNPKGDLQIPSTRRDDPTGLIVSPDGTKETGPDLFPLEANGIDFSDLKWREGDPIPKIIIKEIAQDYDFDSIPFQEGDFVIDLGAHVGLVSFYLASKFEGLQILAVEPDPDNFAYLKENLARFPSVTVANIAATGDGRNVSITPDPKNSGASSIYKNGEVIVRSLSLRDLIGNYKVKLLKLDAEGAEYEIIGADPDALTQVEYIRGEIHQRPTLDPNALLEIIKRYIAEDKIRLTIQGGK